MIFSVGIDGFQKDGGFAFHERNNMDIPIEVNHQDFLMGAPVPARMDFDGQELLLATAIEPLEGRYNEATFWPV